MEQVIWISIIVLLLLIELYTNDIKITWFILSALCSVFISLFTKNYLIQFLVFVILGTILYINFNSKLKKYIKQNKNKKLIKFVINFGNKKNNSK